MIKITEKSHHGVSTVSIRPDETNLAEMMIVHEDGKNRVVMVGAGSDMELLVQLKVNGALGINEEPQLIYDKNGKKSLSE